MKLLVVCKHQSSQPAQTLPLPSKSPKNIPGEGRKSCEPALRTSDRVCFLPSLLEPAPAPIPPGPGALPELTKAQGSHQGCTALSQTPVFQHMTVRYISQRDTDGPWSPRR